MSWKSIDFTAKSREHRAMKAASVLHRELRQSQDPLIAESGVDRPEPPLHEGKARSNGVRYPEMIFSPSKPTGKHVPLPNEGPAHRWPSEKDFGHDYTVTGDVR